MYVINVYVWHFRQSVVQWCKCMEKILLCMAAVWIAWISASFFDQISIHFKYLQWNHWRGKGRKKDALWMLKLQQHIDLCLQIVIGILWNQQNIVDLQKISDLNHCSSSELHVCKITKRLTKSKIISKIFISMFFKLLPVF